METSDVRRRVQDAIRQSKRRAAEHRARADRASQTFDMFLERTAVPLVHQIANVLRAEGHLFTVFTPAGRVRLMSDRTAQDFVEVSLDVAGDPPRVIAHSSRGWGNRVIETEQVVGSGDPETLSEEALLEFLLRELGPFFEK